MQTGEALGPSPYPYTQAGVRTRTPTHTHAYTPCPRSSGMGGESAHSHPLWWGRRGRGCRGTGPRAGMRAQGPTAGPWSLASPWRPIPAPANPVCSLSPGAGGRREPEWNRNSMWGSSPLAPTKPAFLFLLFHASLPTTLPVSLFRFLLCRLMFGLTQVVCFAEQGAPQLVSATLPHLSLRLPAWEKRLPVCPMHAGICRPSWLGRRSRLPWEPTRQSPCWLQRQDWVSPVASHPLTASSSYSRVPRLPALEAWEGCGQRSSERGPLCPSPSLSIGLALELWQLLGSGRGREGWGTPPIPPSPWPFWGSLGPARPSPSPRAPLPLPCAQRGLCSPGPHWSAPELQGPADFLRSAIMGC